MPIDERPGMPQRGRCSRQDGIKGFEPSNPWWMRTFYLTYPILYAVRAELSWIPIREMREEWANPAIGILLCADKNDTVVRYTLSEGQQQIFFALPLAVAERRRMNCGVPARAGTAQPAHAARRHRGTGIIQAMDRMYSRPQVTQ